MGIDPRNLIPDKYQPKVGEVQVWRDWSFRAKAYLSATLDAKLKDVLDQAEGQAQEIKRADSEAMGMKPEWDAELRSFLGAKTDGTAFSLVRSSPNTPAVELWRLLALGGDPKSAGGTLGDIKDLMKFPRCSDLKKLPDHIQAWEDKVEVAETRAGSVILGESLKKANLLQICPEDIDRELTVLIDNFPTYASLRQKIVGLSVDRSRAGGSSKMPLHPLEEQKEWTDEEWLEAAALFFKGKGKKGGGKGAKGKGKSGGKGDDRQCYRCGKYGHISPDCKSTLHADGGPLREKPKAKELELSPDAPTEAVNAQTLELGFGNGEFTLFPLTLVGEENEDKDNQGDEQQCEPCHLLQPPGLLADQVRSWWNWYSLHSEASHREESLAPLHYGGGYRRQGVDRQEHRERESGGGARGPVAPDRL